MMTWGFIVSNSLHGIIPFGQREGVPIPQHDAALAASDFSRVRCAKAPVEAGKNEGADGACAALDFKILPAARSVSLRNVRESLSSEGSKRTAVCIVGQLRSLPIAFINWRDGFLFDWLTRTGHSVDFFVVTSKSNSYTVWGDFLQVLCSPSCSVAFDLFAHPESASYSERGSPHFSFFQW